MKNYFIKHPTKEQEGPLSLEQLKNLNLNDEYQIWTEGFENWKKITDVEELKGYFIKLPPKSNNEDNIIKEKKDIAVAYSVTAWIIGSAIIFIVMGGLKSNSEITENLYSYSNYTDELAIKVRLIYAVISIIISGVISLSYYAYHMMIIYKEAYFKTKLN